MVPARNAAPDMMVDRNIGIPIPHRMSGVWRTVVCVRERSTVKPRLFGRLVGGLLWCGACVGVPSVAPAEDILTFSSNHRHSPPSTSPPAISGAASSSISIAQSDSEPWHSIRPFLPDPGNFAIIPGSELTPVLVRNGEFSFCDQIKCDRSPSVLGAWNGGAFDVTRGQFRVHGGGHADYGGNEVYVFNFSTLKWTRETNPQPLTGPFMRSSTHAAAADACPAPASGPPATHTYQGFLYVPKIDRYWLFGSYGFCKKGMGHGGAWEYDATSHDWVSLPQLAPYAGLARAIIAPDSGNVIIHTGRKNGWREIDPTSRKIVRSFDKDSFGAYSDGPAIFDERRDAIFALIGGGGTDRLIAYDWSALGSSRLTGRLIAEWPKGGKTGWGMAQDASGLLVLWDGNTRIVTVNPDSGETLERQAGGATYRSRGAARGASAKVYSKWAYIPKLEAFFGITNPDIGVVLYRLPSAVTNTLQ